MALLKIGEGKTPEEKMLETAVNKIADWCGKDIRYERILAGFTNLNWKVYLAEDQKTFFLKIPGPNTEILTSGKEASMSLHFVYGLSINSPPAGTLAANALKICANVRS